MHGPYIKIFLRIILFYLLSACTHDLLQQCLTVLSTVKPKVKAYIFYGGHGVTRTMGKLFKRVLSVDSASFQVHALIFTCIT